MSTKLLDGHDYDELDALLDSVGRSQGLGLDGVHGLLSALAVGPRKVNAEQWLPLALGVDPRIIQHADVDRCVELLLTLSESIDYGLQHYAYEPVLMEHRDEHGDSEVDQYGWCVGFAAGVDLLAEYWEAKLCDESVLIEAATPLQRLGVSCESFTRCLPAAQTMDHCDREALIRRIPACLIDIRHFWEEQRDDHQPRSHRLH